MARVLRTELSRSDTKSIAHYLAEQSQSRRVALRFIESIVEKCDLYASRPNLGEACPDLGNDVRRFPVGNYVVFYRPLPDGIEVLRVLHGSRDIPAIWRL
jgi:toxin ParE1/3/4